ncbi:hypothetical protein KI387_041903, partial [Taxus chinensis]
MTTSSGHASIDAGLIAGALDNGTETSEEIHPEGIRRGKDTDTPSPDIVLDLPAFDKACNWFESFSLVAYFVGRVPPEGILRQWIHNHWQPHGVKVEGVQNMTKGFFCFTLPMLNTAKPLLTMVHGLFVTPLWFSPTGLDIFKSLSKPNSKFLFGSNFQASLCLCGVSLINLSNPWAASSAMSKVGDTRFSQKVLYINLPNTCFRCQSADHMIKDCPLMNPSPPPVSEKAPIDPKSNTPSSDGWTTVNGRKPSASTRNKHQQATYKPVATPASAPLKPSAATPPKPTPTISR